MTPIRGSGGGKLRGRPSSSAEEWEGSLKTRAKVDLKRPQRCLISSILTFVGGLHIEDFNRAFREAGHRRLEGDSPRSSALCISLL